MKEGGIEMNEAGFIASLPVGMTCKFGVIAARRVPMT